MPTSEQYSLFRAYIDARHADGGMADMTVLDYAMMVEDSVIDTFVTEYRMQAGQPARSRPETWPLEGVALCDRLSDGISMVYSFYDPEATRAASARYMILEHIEYARRLACRISISATGSRARARWATRGASSRRNGSAPTAGSAATDLSSP